MRFSAVLVLLAGCVTAPSHPQQPDRVALARQLHSSDGTVVGEGGVAPKGKFLCQMEVPLGSHIPTKVCRYLDDDADSINARNQIHEGLNNMEAGVGCGDKVCPH